MSSSKTIGIIGGGQLGQMMAISAIYMGHKVIALDPAADCPASRVAEIIVAPYNDVDALRQLAERCDVLTYEFENVDADGLDAVIKDGQLPQGTDLLRISQGKSLSVLSGGEIIKLLLAKMLMGRYNILIMDEPSNFLDIPSLEALEILMKEYTGTIVFITHDKRLLENVADVVYEIRDKKINLKH